MWLEKPVVSSCNPSVYYNWSIWTYRSSHPEVFLRKGVLKICSKFTGEQPSRSVISIKLKSNFVEITLQHVCSSVHLLHIFRAPFPKNTSGRLLLNITYLLIHFFYSSCSGSSRMTNGSVLPKSYKYTTIIFPIVSNEFWQKCIYEQF